MSRCVKPLRGGLAVVIALLVSGMAGCGRRPVEVNRRAPMPQFDGADAYLECVEFVKLGPKPACTPMAERAAHYLYDRLTQFGIEARIDLFHDEIPGGTGVFRNVIGRIPGDTNRLVVIAAHYDTKSGISDEFAGANDSGSGVGVALALMKAMAEHPVNGMEIRCVFFDGEECRYTYGAQDGLHGSRWLARQWVASGEAIRIKALILLDMVGDRNLTITLPRNGTPALLSAVFEAAANEGARDRFFLYAGDILDDHQPFLEAGIPAVNIIDFRYGSTSDGNEYWHTTEDTLDKISADSLGVVGRVTIRVMSGL